MSSRMQCLGSQHLLSNSLEDPNAHPPTPKQTPTSAAFPSPVFATPRQNQGTFSEPEPGSWTPRFAEEYSVFNSTPGNLRGSEGTFGDFAPFTPASRSTCHRRLISSESTSTGLPPHVNHFSPNPNYHFPHADPAHQLPSSPCSLTATKDKALRHGALPSPNPSVQTSGSQPLQGSSQGSTQTQTATPPPSSRKDERKLGPKLKMQQDGHDFGQPDFVGTSQPQDLSGLLGSPGDLFSYPMSAPVTGPDSFWDPSSLALPMDMDFSTANIFQPDTPSGHRQSGSFDWNNEVQMFQDLPQQPPAASSKQRKTQPAARKARTLAPKPPTSGQLSSAAQASNSMSSILGIDNPFGIMGSGRGVDPEVLSSRPQTAAADSSFNAMNDAGSAEAALAGSTKGQSSSGVRRSTSVKDARNGKMPDRAFVSSPVKPSAARPGLGRSQSESRGRKSIGRGAIVNPPSTFRPVPPARNGSGLDSGRNPVRLSGRVSPLKKQHRLSLASIPESASRPGSRASVKFYIGADGRAHAEAAHAPGDSELTPRGPRSHTSGDAQQWDDEYDSSSTDDEPIIIPSRNNSFNASFALPDPRRPVGSIFHSSRRSVSDKSTSTLTNSDAHNGVYNDVESEAETVMNEGLDQDGADAANELLRVKENRQQGPNIFSTTKSQRFFAVSGGGLHGNSISQTRRDEPGVRCVCHRNEMTGFLVQW
ncbi:hypothetical protein ACO1O0_001402 [Amphichorda felina]